MPFDKFQYPEEVWKERRTSVSQSLQTIDIDQLKKIAKEHEDEFVGDPWIDEFLRLMAEHPRASFYRAMPENNIVVFYCRDADFGMWVVPGAGSGPLNEKGKSLMKEAIEGSLAGHKLEGTT